MHKKMLLASIVLAALVALWPIEEGQATNNAVSGGMSSSTATDTLWTFSNTGGIRGVLILNPDAEVVYGVKFQSGLAIAYPVSANSAIEIKGRVVSVFCDKNGATARCGVYPIRQ